MFMNKYFTLLFFLLILAMTFSGCYTVLMHPQTEEGYAQEDYQDACIDCHTDYNDYPYGYFYGDHYSDYWWSTPRYGYYYAYPWWWDYYWSPSEGRQVNSQNEDVFVPRSSTGEKATRRGSIRPPYVEPLSNPGTTTITRGGGSGGRGGSVKEGNTQTGKDSTNNNNNGNNNNNQDQQQKQQTQPDNTKKTRRGGGRQ